MTNNRVRFTSEPGDRHREVYHARYDANGDVILISDGVVDAYAEIQSHAPSVDIHVLLRRYANGDPGALSRRQGIYADVTGMPRTYADLLNTVNDLERHFASLPHDVRERFGQSFARWAASLGTPEYWENLGVSRETPAREIVKEDTPIEP